MTTTPPPPYGPPQPPNGPPPYGPPPYGPTWQQPPQKPPKKKRNWPLTILGWIFLIGFIVFIVNVANDQGGSSGNTTQSRVVDAVDPTAKDPNSYVALTSRDYALITKDPDAHKGSRIVVYGDVTQFDVVTGPTMFRADTTATADGDDSILSGTNTIVMGSKAELAPVVQGDKVKIFAEVIGSDSYENALGNEMAVLTLTANMVEVLPPS